jgi:hypothetical protein
MQQLILERLKREIDTELPLVFPEEGTRITDEIILSTVANNGE